jgi:hypothetical protein
MQEGGTFEANVHERRLHAGQHAHDLAAVDIADDAAVAGALDVHLLQHAVFDDRHTGFLRRHIYEDLFAHAPSRIFCRMPASS